jgi:hypothetical protein
MSNQKREDASKFAEWVACNHFVLYDIVKGIYYWKSETETLTTEQLRERYEKAHKNIL